MNEQSTRAIGAVAVAMALVAVLAGPASAEHFESLAVAAWGEHRAEGNRDRNRYRHPIETLTFLGVAPDMTVAEVSPGGGWYTEILAPYLRDQGKLYAAAYDPQSEGEYYRNSANRFRDKLSANPEIYDKVALTVFEPPAKLEVAPAGTADVVLTFRNMHGWLRNDTARAAFDAMHRALKPGGVLGVVQHRGEPGNPDHRSGEAGYIDENYVIGFIEAAGFELVDRSEINANPADPRDHSVGVWALPPSLELGDEDRERYLRIGESDRMTLKFVKR